MKLLNLKLRGAIGVKKGLALDEIEIDFTKFAPGLIALTGKNGSSKSTILENCHPYRCMVSRTGSLQSHFFLKDSYRILKFELDNKIYESKTFIDALTGGSESYLYCNDVALNDGKLTTFDEELEKVLGSQELFFNSVFSGQRSKGIAELKPADRRKLFYELLNLNIYDQYLETAKANLKTNEIKLAEIEGQINSFSVGEDELTQLEQNRITALNNIANTEIEITKVEAALEQINSAIRDAEIEIAKLEEKQKANKEIEARLKQLSINSDVLIVAHNSKIGKLNSDLEDTKKLISHNQKLLLRKDEIKDKLETIELLEANIKGATDLKTELLQKKSLILRQHSQATEGLNKKNEELRAIEKGLSDYEHRYNNLEKDLENYESQSKLIGEVPCTEEIGAACKFLSNAYKSASKIDKTIEELESLKKEYPELKDSWENLNKLIIAERKIIEEKYQLGSSETSLALNQVEKDLNTFKFDLQEYLPFKKLDKDAAEAETNVKILTGKMENIQASIDATRINNEAELYRLSKESEDLHKKLDLKILDKLSYVKNVLGVNENKKEYVIEDLSTSKKTLEYYKSVLSDCEAQLDQLKKNETKIKELEVKKGIVQSEIKDWTFLTKAFDKTGIPVLKLENSGIEITTIANELLSLFENKFRIVFETTQLKADKKSYKESFNINVIQEEGVTELSNLSGGEQVWVETAIQLAISNVVRQQGRNILTSFLDECDGALSTDNAYLYLEMLRKSHANSNLYSTFIITHRTELLDLLPQKIYLHDGLLDIINNN